MVHILVLEDEASIREFVKINLLAEGYTVWEAETGYEALEQVQAVSKIQISILDLMVPGIDGLEVCRRLRAQYPDMGIIILTARGQEQDCLAGLSAGADDYVVKPFSPRELMARIKALLRRMHVSAPAASDDSIQNGPFLLQPKERRFYKNQKEISLSPTEFELMHLFLRYPGQAFSRDDILDRVWGIAYEGYSKIVDVNVRRIRTKIEDNPAQPIYLCSVWGYGYRWGKEDTA